MKNLTLPNGCGDLWLGEIANKLELKDPLSREYLRLSLQNVVLFDSKQQDYGPKNISSFGYFGCIVRMSDKFERIKNLVGLKKKAKNEKIEDTLRDVHVYANIALMCQKGQWPS